MTSRIRFNIFITLVILYLNPYQVSSNDNISIQRTNGPRHVVKVSQHPNHQPFDSLQKPQNRTGTFYQHRETGTGVIRQNGQDGLLKNHRVEENQIKENSPPQVLHDNKKDKFSLFIDDNDEDYKPNHHLANKQKNMRTMLINLLKKRENNKDFAAVLPILRVMSPEQRLAMVSLVTSQMPSDGRNAGLKLSQVTSMFGSNSNATTDLMLPIILDIANLLKAFRPNDKKKSENLPRPELLRRSFSDDAELNFPNVVQISKKSSPRSLRRMDVMDEDEEDVDLGVINNSTKNVEPHQAQDKSMKSSVNSNLNEGSDIIKPESLGNSTAEVLPVAEELRYVTKFKNVNPALIRRAPVRRPIPAGEHLPPVHLNRRMSIELQRRRQALAEQQKIETKCNFFTESLCLDVHDYPIQAITSSIRKNLNVMNALHSDFPEISADSALDGISKKQEEKYTPEHYLNNINRREDGEVRPADASGFMCPSIVKYARPQKARATSGQWKYIVNTGEHTQTLRLEKCLKAKESCTFLTDNFKSKCIQVYNYHRLLTWDQQNGLHMDIFKVPTCCSCHIEGYNFAYPPHVSKPIEVTSETFPGDEIIHESATKNRYIFSSNPKLTASRETILNAFKTGNTDEYSSLSNLHKFNRPKIEQLDTQEIAYHPSLHQFPSTNTNFYDDIYQTQDTNIIRNVKKPGDELPSFLEPPSAAHPKLKTGSSVYVKRGQVGNRGNVLKQQTRKPIRKKISETHLEDQEPGASENQETLSNEKVETTISRNSHTRIPVIIRSSTENPSNLSTTDKHLNKIDRDKESENPKDINSINRRVNYNYHPIIDFFGESSNERTNHVASDRMDPANEYISHEESDWRPVTGPIV